MFHFLKDRCCEIGGELAIVAMRCTGQDRVLFVKYAENQRLREWEFRELRAGAVRGFKRAHRRRVERDEGVYAPGGDRF